MFFKNFLDKRSYLCYHSAMEYELNFISRAIIRVENIFMDEVHPDELENFAASREATISGDCKTVWTVTAPCGIFTIRNAKEGGGIELYHESKGKCDLDPALLALMGDMASTIVPQAGRWGYIGGSNLQLWCIFFLPENDTPQVPYETLPYLDDGLEHRTAVFEEWGRRGGTDFCTKRGRDYGRYHGEDVQRVYVSLKAVTHRTADPETMVSDFAFMKERLGKLLGKAMPCM